MKILETPGNELIVARLELPLDKHHLQTVHDAYDIEYGFSREQSDRDLLIDYLTEHGSIYHLIVLFVEEQPAGYIRAYDRLSTSSCDVVMMLDLVYIFPAYRGKGFGRILMNALISYSKSNHKARIDLLTDLDNPAAVKLYESLGFKGRERHQMILFVKDHPDLVTYFESKQKTGK